MLNYDNRNNEKTPSENTPRKKETPSENSLNQITKRRQAKIRYEKNAKRKHKKPNSGKDAKLKKATSFSAELHKDATENPPREITPSEISGREIQHCEIMTKQTTQRFFVQFILLFMHITSFRCFSFCANSAFFCHFFFFAWQFFSLFYCFVGRFIVILFFSLGVISQQNNDRNELASIIYHTTLLNSINTLRVEIYWIGSRHYGTT